MAQAPSVRKPKRKLKRNSHHLSCTSKRESAKSLQYDSLEKRNLLASVSAIDLYDFPGRQSDDTSQIVEFGEGVAFVRQNQAEGNELYVAAGDEVQLIDLTPGPTSTNPEHLTIIDNQLYFVGVGTSGDDTLWKYEWGSDSATEIVIENGSVDRRANIVAFDGQIYFGLIDNEFGSEVGVTDGTNEGTRLFANLNGDSSTDPFEFRATSDRLYFSSGNSNSGLWVSDGSVSGTQMLLGASGPTRLSLKQVIGDRYYFASGTGPEQLYVASGDSVQSILALGSESQIGARENFSDEGFYVQNGDELIFYAQNDSSFAIYETNGLGAPTVITNAVRGSDLAMDMAVFGGNLYFTDRIRNVWQTDLTDNSTQAFWPFQTFSFFENNGKLGFTSNVPETGWELWQTDGTVNGTGLIFETIDGADSLIPYEAINVNNDYFFRAIENNQIGNWAAYSSEDDVNLVSLVVDDTTLGSQPRFLGVFNDQALFRLVRTSSVGNGVLLSDGTVDGTFEIASEGTFGLTGAPIGDQLYYLSTEGVFVTDGSPDGQVQLATGFDSSISFAEWNGQVYFNLGGVWVTDGTPEGTAQIDSGSINGSLWSGDDAVYFSRSGDLWKSTGTLDETELVVDFPFGRGIDTFLQNVNGLTLFTVRDSAGNNLWVTDGTAEGTTLLADAKPEQLLVLNGVGYFADGNELWATDGTVKGTTLIDSLPQPITEMYLYEDELFISSEGLWKSDGSAGNITVVSNAITSAEHFAAFNGNLYFVGENAELGREIWRTDGSMEGTVNVLNLAYGAIDAQINGMVATEGNLFLQYTTTALGEEVGVLSIDPIAGIDFGTETSPLQNGFTPTFDSAYSPEAGFGWAETEGLELFEIRRGNDITRDVVQMRSGTFKIDVLNGDYDIRVFLGAIKKNDSMSITVNGTTDTFAPNRGPNVFRDYTATVTNGLLEFNFDGLGGLNDRIRIAGIELTPVAEGRSAKNVGVKNGRASATILDPRTKFESMKISKIQGRTNGDFEQVQTQNVAESRRLAGSSIFNGASTNAINSKLESTAERASVIALDEFFGSFSMD